MHGVLSSLKTSMYSCVMFTCISDSIYANVSVSKAGYPSVCLFSTLPLSHNWSLYLSATYNAKEN